MSNARTIESTATATPQTKVGAVAIPIKHLPYLRFLSAVLNKPLNEVAARFPKRKG